MSNVVLRNGIWTVNGRDVYYNEPHRETMIHVVTKGVEKTTAAVEATQKIMDDKRQSMMDCVALLAHLKSLPSPEVEALAIKMEQTWLRTGNRPQRDRFLTLAKMVSAKDGGEVVKQPF